LVNAEELGVTAANVDSMKTGSKDPNVRRLLGAEGNFGEAMGLGADWAFQAVKQLGNYGEMFERNLGQATPLGISRGLNALWNQGGLQYAPPIR